MNLALLFLCCMAAHPSMEAPKPKPQHRFYDRTAKVQLSVNAALLAADSAQTCNNLWTRAKLPTQGFIPSPTADYYGREYFLPVHNCADVILFMTGEHLAQEGVAYLMHRTGHHRAERLVRFGMTEEHVRGLAYSKAHGAF